MEAVSGDVCVWWEGGREWQPHAQFKVEKVVVDIVAHTDKLFASI